MDPAALHLCTGMLYATSLSLIQLFVCAVVCVQVAVGAVVGVGVAAAGGDAQVMHLLCGWACTGRIGTGEQMLDVSGGTGTLLLAPPTAVPVAVGGCSKHASLMPPEQQLQLSRQAGGATACGDGTALHGFMCGADQVMGMHASAAGAVAHIAVCS